MELTKNTKAERAVKRLAMLEKRKKDRWRINIESSVAPVTAAFAFIVSMLAICLGTEVWWPLGLIFGGVAWGFPIERGVRNLYSCAAIHWQKNQVNKLRKNDGLFQVNLNLVNKWQTAVRRADGDPYHPSVQPQEHWGMFADLVYWDQKLNDSRTDEENKPEIKALIDKIINKHVADAVAPALSEAVKEHLDAAAHNDGIRRELETYKDSLESDSKPEIEKETFHK